MRGMSVTDLIAALEEMRAAGKDRVFVSAAWGYEQPIHSVTIDRHGDVRIQIGGSVLDECPLCGGV